MQIRLIATKLARGVNLFYLTVFFGSSSYPQCFGVINRIIVRIFYLRLGGSIHGYCNYFILIILCSSVFLLGGPIDRFSVMSCLGFGTSSEHILGHIQVLFYFDRWSLCRLD